MAITQFLKYLVKQYFYIHYTHVQRNLWKCFSEDSIARES